MENQFDAVAEAQKYGIDITLLYSNLKKTPSERLQDLQSMLIFVEKLRQAKQSADASNRKNPPATA